MGSLKLNNISCGEEKPKIFEESLNDDHDDVLELKPEAPSACG